MRCALLFALTAALSAAPASFRFDKPQLLRSGQVLSTEVQARPGESLQQLADRAVRWQGRAIRRKVDSVVLDGARGARCDVTEDEGSTFHLTVLVARRNDRCAMLCLRYRHAPANYEAQVQRMIRSFRWR